MMCAGPVVSLCALVATLAWQWMAGTARAETHAPPDTVVCNGDPECARSALARMLERWRARSSNPLIGQVYDLAAPPLAGGAAAAPQPISEFPPVFARASDGGTAILILGELHDNAEHHALRALIAPQRSDEKSGNVVPWVFEQFRANHQSALDELFTLRHVSPGDFTLEDLERRIAWEKSGWGKLGYEPLLQTAFDAVLPLYAGDASGAQIMKVAKEGESALPLKERARLRLDVPLADADASAAAIEIERAHCDQLPRDMVPKMAYAQRYRDAHLADVTLKAAEKYGSVVLFTGNGHARTDRGVPWYVRARAPEAKVVSVLLVEVEEDKTDPDRYVPRDPFGRPVAHFLIFTPRAVRPDPCSQLPEIQKN